MIAQVTLGSGQVGYFDGLSGIRLTPYQPTADVVYGMNTTQLEADVAAGKIVLLNGTLNATLAHTEMGVYRKPATEITVEKDPPLSVPPKMCFIRFSANGGSGIMKPVMVEAETDYTIPDNTFTAPTGKQFKTFNDEKDGSGTAYDPQSTTQLTENITLYAIWEAAAVQTSAKVRRAARSSSTNSTSTATTVSTQESTETKAASTKE